jgi:hypothetical protein
MWILTSHPEIAYSQRIGDVDVEVISRYVERSGNDMRVGEKETLELVFFPFLATESKC